MIAPRVQFSPIVGGYLVLGTIGAAALLWFLHGGAQKAAAAVAAVPGELAAGAVQGVGDSIGIPRTDQTQCDADLAAGRMWSASFSCPASRFIGGLFGSAGDEQTKKVVITDTSGVDTAGASASASPAGYGGIFQ